MRKILLSAVGSMIILSCNTKNEEVGKDSRADTEVMTHIEHENGTSESIRLNNNQKWAVNNEMKPFVMKGEEFVNTYLKTKATDYKKLAAELKAENDQLIKSCTMDGASHDELHKWLHPHLELTRKLEQSVDAAQAKMTVVELQKSYKQYHEYFN